MFVTSMDVSSDPYLPYDGGGGDGIPLRELHKRGMPDWRLGYLFAWLYVRDRCPRWKRGCKGLLIIELLFFACPIPFVGGELSSGWFLCCQGLFSLRADQSCFTSHRPVTPSSMCGRLPFRSLSGFFMFVWFFFLFLINKAIS